MSAVTNSDDPIERDGRMGHEVARAEQADLLEVEADEHDAPLRRCRRLDDAAGHLEHHGHARGIVIRPGVELAAANTQVVEMGRHDHPLIAQRRVGAAQHRADVPADPVPGSLPGIGLEEFSLEQAPRA